MDRLTFDDLESSVDAWDAAVDATSGIDRWCTSSYWALPVFETWGNHPADVFHAPDIGWAAFGSVELPDGRARIGPDGVWGFASCMVGPDAPRLAEAVARALDQLNDWDAVFMTGLLTGGALDRAVIEAFGRRHRLFAGPESPRCVAELADGVDAWWGRRSERFRRNLRRARAAALAEGLELRVLDDCPADEVMDRILALETQSWKGREGSGLVDPRMASAYRSIAGRLGAADSLRVCVAVLDGHDVGYVLGGVRAGTYRGLQISYSADHRSMSIGHLLQDHELHRVAAEGVQRYDLGMDLEYKRRWSDTLEVTRTIVAVR